MIHKGEDYCYASCPTCFKDYGYFKERHLFPCKHMKGLYTALIVELGEEDKGLNDSFPDINLSKTPSEGK